MNPDKKTDEDGLRRHIEALKAEAVEQVAAAKRARPDITVWWEDLPTDEFVRRLIEQMTNDQAETIKQWRETHTWRAVAARMPREVHVVLGYRLDDTRSPACRRTHL